MFFFLFDFNFQEYCIRFNILVDFGGRFEPTPTRGSFGNLQPRAACALYRYLLVAVCVVCQTCRPGWTRNIHSRAGTV